MLVGAEVGTAPQGENRGQPFVVGEVERQRLRGLEHPEFFHADDLESATAENYRHPLWPFVADVPPFAIPNGDYDRILAYIRKCELDPKPWAHEQEQGTVRFIYKGGYSARLCWFWTGQGGRLVFTWAGIRYRTTGEKFAEDETLAFDAMIRKISEQQRAGPARK
jgi:hypothetical protein